MTDALEMSLLALATIAAPAYRWQLLLNHQKGPNLRLFGVFNGPSAPNLGYTHPNWM